MPDRYYRQSEPLESLGDWDHYVEFHCAECGGSMFIPRSDPYPGPRVVCIECQDRARRWAARLQAKADLQRQRNAK